MKNNIDNSSFIEWLNGEREKRGWTSNALAKKADFSATQLYYIEQNKRKPGPEVCDKIAWVLQLEPEYVYRKAHILNAQEEIVNDIKLATHYLGIMTPAERAIVLGMIESVATKERGRAIQTAPPEEKRS
jgi:DNA-binding XRE family transcriptional regulator